MFTVEVKSTLLADLVIMLSDCWLANAGITQDTVIQSSSCLSNADIGQDTVIQSSSAFDTLSLNPTLPRPSLISQLPIGLPTAPSTVGTTRTCEPAKQTAAASDSETQEAAIDKPPSSTPGHKNSSLMTSSAGSFGATLPEATCMYGSRKAQHMSDESTLTTCTDGDPGADCASFQASHAAMLEAAWVLSVLQSLSRSGRFELNVRLLPSKCKAALTSLFSELSDAAVCSSGVEGVAIDPASVSSVALHYGVVIKDTA